jgi:hypothetical protein
MSDQMDGAADRSHRTWDVLLSAIAAVGLAVGVAVVVAVIVVRTVVLDPAPYTTALAETGAYDRVYTEVLADPDLADLKEDLLGDLGVPPALAVQARALGVNVLRWTVPPSTLRRLSENVIGSALAYVRGDTPRLQAAVVVDDIAGRVPEATIREVRALLASAADATLASLDDLRASLGEVADQLAVGTVPAAIPGLGGTTIDPDRVADAIVDVLGAGADDELRTMVLGAVLAGDQRDAVIDAAGELVRQHASAGAERLRAEPTIDVTALVAAHAHRPVASVVDAFDWVRAMARWLGPWTAAAGALLAVGGAAALVAIHRRRRRVAGRWIAGALIGAGVAVVVAWIVVRGTVASPLDAATTAGPDGWRLPPALAALLGDVAGHVGARLDGTMWRAAAVLVLGGVTILAAGAVTAVFRRRPRSSPAAVGVGGLVVLALFGVVVGTRPRDEHLCNGHVELCGRPYDDVTYAATHNSMSSPEVVPVWPEHDGGITAQLDAGVRALLIDTDHWPPLDSAGQLAAAVAGDEPRLPPALAEALYQQVATVRDGHPGAFLCHIHCAFGAQPLVEGLGEVRDFLAANPDDVVTLIIQDAISPAETAAAFDAAGLTSFVYAHVPGQRYPTLGQMIHQGQRLVVFAEAAGSPPDWYANAFEAMQETPFLFLSPERFSCAENRGDPEASLFLINHWIQRIAPDRADAARVNRLDVLVDRARQCERERGLRPNYLAVNFYDIGDVVAAADVLNGFAG